MDYIKEKDGIKHIVTYRTADAIAYTDTNQHLKTGDRVILMVGTNDILDNTSSDDIIINIRNIIDNLKTRDIEYKILQLPPNHTSTEADHETIYLNRTIQREFGANTITTTELYTADKPTG